MSGSPSQSKLGQGHAASMARLGLKELSQILPAFPDSVRTQDDPGLVGNATQREVYEQRNSPVVEGHDLYGRKEAQSPQRSQPDHDLDMGMNM